MSGIALATVGMSAAVGRDNRLARLLPDNDVLDLALPPEAHLQSLVVAVGKGPLIQLLDGWDGSPERATDDVISHYSAEISGFARARALPDLSTPLLLLCSDTPSGVLAGMIVGMLCRRPLRHLPSGADQARTRSVVDLGEPLDSPGARSDAAPAVVARMEFMSTTSPQQYGSSMRPLADLLNVVCQDPRAGAGLHLNLNGGYKATLPFMTLLASFLQYRLGRSVRATIAHEQMGQAVDIPLFGRLIDDDVLDELVLARDGTAPPIETLEGIAYEREGRGTVRLRDEGRAICRLLGLDEPARGSL